MLLSVAQAAERAAVCESVIRSWVSAGLLPHFRLGKVGTRGKIVIAVEDLDGVLAGFKVGGRASEPAPRSRTIKLRHLELPS